MTVLSTCGVAAHDRPLAFTAWTSIDGRSAEIADALGGEARGFYALRIVRKPLVPLRYAWSALGTISYWLRLRPRAAIASSRPTFPGLSRAGRVRAVYAIRPLVVSDWPVLREVFPYAGHVENSPQAIAVGMRAANARHAELVEATVLALEVQRSRCDRQLATRETLTSRSSDTHVALEARV
jgi:hypothetical protein